jgi:hypothetical protein
MIVELAAFRSQKLDVLAAYIFTKEEEDTPTDGEEDVPKNLR